MFPKFTIVFFSLIIVCAFSCVNNDVYTPIIPDSFPVLIIPSNNQLTDKKVKLGERLFNDPNISIDSTVMCASCHKQDLAFADSVSISPGVHGRLGDRNSPSLINAAFSPLINKDGGVTKLDIQALIPIEDHNEMGISIIELSKRLSDDQAYVHEFQNAFGRDPDGFTIPRAFSSYVRSLIDATTPYDEYLQGNKNALKPSEKRGLALFSSEELACATCHSGPLLTNFDFENNGLYEEYEDLGRALITLKKEDHGKFKIPSLRNIALTAPYMHNGKLSTLEAVIDHYSSGGSSHANKSDLINGFELSQGQQSDLLSFLNSLTSQDLQSIF